MRNIFLLLTFLSFFSTAYGQILEPVKWHFEEENLGNDEYLLTFRAVVEDEWSVYSQFTSDEGPVPTKITYDNADIEKIGETAEIGHRKEGFDKLFETTVIKFLGDKDFVIKQKIKKKSVGPLKGYLTFMTCNNKTCLPPTDVDFSFPLAGATIKKEVKKEPKLIEAPKKENIFLPAEKKTVVKVPEFKKEVVTVNKPTTPKKAIQPKAEKKKIVIETPKTKKAEPKIDIATIKMDLKPAKKDKILEPVKWTFESKKISDNEYELRYIANIAKGWSTYSQHTSDEGPVPTAIVYKEEKEPSYELVGKNIEKGARKEMNDPIFGGVKVIKFLDKKPFEIVQKVKIYGEGANIEGFLTYMACDDKTCLPPTDVDFDFQLGNITSQPISATKVGDKIDQRRPDIVSTYKEPVGNCSADTDGEDSSLLWLFIAGLLGGFAALLTPCVFPMIPITVSFFTKDTKRKGWMNGLIYAASIIVIYVLLGLIITLAFGPEALNALSTNWIANVIFFIIFIVFAFSFFGFYEITLPSSWTTKTDAMADKGGLLGIFFMATTLSLVSFSCTGPIVGSALVAAANGGIVGPLVVMLGFSIALSLPFGLFAAFPAWLNSLPRSGGWMNSVKVVLGFLEVGFAFKFLSTADLTQHWGFLRYELFMGILIVVMIAIVIYLLGYIKFPHDSPLKKLSPTRIGFAVFFAAVAIYLASGFQINKETGIYKSLSAISGFPPPVKYNYFLDSETVNADIKAKYPSFSKCANNIDCFKDYYEGMAYAKAQNKPAFIDFTGHGCQNCRRTEDNIWVKSDIRKILNDEVVLISLYTDDRKKLDDPFISLNDGKKKRTVGAKWADFEVVNFAQNSQPLYIMMTPEEKVITTPRGYEDSADSYLDYLNCGLNWYKNNK